MRYMIKGGLWKNSEDEILKAAVMKYGLNQWSRISSLLVRKSAKQCKARWYEWLDPSIKKTEWTREEEEKLLHLAKIFPCQWRTIAPVVGRTPAQCAEHYEKLLDQAQGKDETDENDPRKLKPGEIDPNPEIRAARPDPIDMDEDEKEMLAEARVRLANTKGKKAKRKAREKMIEEARRLAGIQKKRELRAAGIEFEVKKKIKGVDYNVEVPFERAPLEMIYKTGTEEDPKPNLHVSNISIQALEGKRRDEEEEKLRKADQRRIKKLKERNLPKAVENISKLNSAISNQKTKLSLPSPQTLDKELEQMGKLNSIQQGQLSNSESNATKMLLGSYSQRGPTPTPMRTPRYESSIMREAQNNIALLRTQTPLLGGENAPLLGVDNSGMTPRTIQMQTPNISGNFMTPMPRNLIPATPKTGIDSSRSTKHDEFNINNEELIDQNWEVSSQTGLSTTNISQGDRLSVAELRKKIRSELFNLPKPKNEYQVDVPELEDFEPDMKKKRILDGEEKDEMMRQNEIQRKEEEERLKSQSLRRNLPRPFRANVNIIDLYVEGNQSEDLILEAEHLLAEEMISILTRDNSLYPFKGVIAEKELPHYEVYELKELEKAEALLKKEMNLYQYDIESAKKLIEEESNDVVYEEEFQKYILTGDFNSNLKIENQRSSFLHLKDKIEKDIKKVEALSKKVSIILGGYPKKLGQIEFGLTESYKQLDQINIERDVFNTLYQEFKLKEKKIISNRIHDKKEFYEKLMKKETELQIKHEWLMRERRDAIEEDPTISFV